MRVWMAVAGGILAASAANAQTSTVYGRATADQARSERLLLLQRADEPAGASARLNLASLYMQTGRRDLAADLYREVLSQDNQLMRTGTGELVWSHRLARRELHRAPAVASR
jgi:thioredoxin-like negative regulator of GroEL